MNAPLPVDREAIIAPLDDMLARQHHRADCPGCDLCTSTDCKIDRSYPDAPDLDCVGRALRPGT